LLRIPDLSARFLLSSDVALAACTGCHFQHFKFIRRYVMNAIKVLVFAFVLGLASVAYAGDLQQAKAEKSCCAAGAKCCESGGGCCDSGSCATVKENSGKAKGTTAKKSAPAKAAAKEKASCCAAGAACCDGGACCTHHADAKADAKGATAKQPAKDKEGDTCCGSGAACCAGGSCCAKHAHKG
jgi:hypothetical protein